MTEQSKKFYDQVEDTVRRCQEGESDVLLDLATLKQMEKVLESARKRVEEIALEELDRSGEKSYAHHGYIFTRTNGRRNWDYSGCPSHFEAKEKLKSIESNLQANYRFMESNGAMSVNSETGEIGEIPKVTFSKDYVTVKQAR
jgi:hypothetical protein